MKIIVISPRFPYPLEKGDKLRLYHQLRFLSKYFEIVLVSLTDTKIDEAHKKHIETFVSKIHIFQLSKLRILFRLFKGIFSSKPFQVLYFFDKSIKSKIDKIFKIEKPDFVFNQLIRTAEYSKDFESIKIIDYMDSFSQGMKKRLGNSSFPFNMIYKSEYKRLKKYEKDIFPFFDKHCIISDQDRLTFHPTINDKISVIPNGVDIDFFNYISKEKKFDISFIGNMGYRPNIIASEYLVKHIYPKIKSLIPNIKIIIAGARPHYRVRSLENDDINVSGWFEDIRDAYGESKIFVAPIFTGIGQQNKILEAMSMQIPVITTPGVNEAIGANSGSEVLIAETEKEFVEHIRFLLNNPGFAEEMGENERNFVKINYSWEYQVQKLLNLFSKKK